MINRYRSPYPNYIHQLFITPSKHLYALKDRRLKWQDKAMEVKLDKIEGQTKNMSSTTSWPTIPLRRSMRK